MKKLAASVVTIFLFLPIVGFSQNQSSGSNFKVLEKIKIGGEGGRDYLAFDAAAHRLYISRSTHVQVFNADKKEVLADIP